MGGAPIYSASSWKRCRESLWRVSGECLLISFLKICLWYILPSKDHIFGPLGMSCSFYLRPELKKNLVDLTYTAGDGKLYPWADQMEIMEQNPDKRRSKPTLTRGSYSDLSLMIIFLASSFASRRRRDVQLHQRLSQTAASYVADSR